MQKYTNTLILIGGGTGSGKTSLAKKLTYSLGEDTCLKTKQDWYYGPDSPHVKKGDFDHPDSFDRTMQLTHLKRLLHGETIKTPRWNYSTHSRHTDWEKTKPRRVIIHDGILVLAMPELLELAALKIFVDTPDDERLIRRIVRDRETRGRTVESVVDQWRETAQRRHLDFCFPSRRWADIIVPNGGNNSRANFILENGLRMLAERDFRAPTPP